MQLSLLGGELTDTEQSLHPVLFRATFVVILARRISICAQFHIDLMLTPQAVTRLKNRRRNTRAWLDWRVIPAMLGRAADAVYLSSIA